MSKIPLSRFLAEQETRQRSLWIEKTPLSPDEKKEILEVLIAMSEKTQALLNTITSSNRQKPWTLKIQRWNWSWKQEVMRDKDSERDIKKIRDAKNWVLDTYRTLLSISRKYSLGNDMVRQELAELIKEISTPYHVAATNITAEQVTRYNTRVVNLIEIPFKEALK